MAMDKQQRLNEVRKEAILLCASTHFEQEQRNGKAVAIDMAKSHLIGATTFLEARIGRDATRAVIDRLRSSL